MTVSDKTDNETSRTAALLLPPLVFQLNFLAPFSWAGAKAGEFSHLAQHSSRRPNSTVTLT